MKDKICYVVGAFDMMHSGKLHPLITFEQFKII